MRRFVFCLFRHILMPAISPCRCFSDILIFAAFFDAPPRHAPFTLRYYFATPPIFALMIDLDAITYAAIIYLSLMPLRCH